MEIKIRKVIKPKTMGRLREFLPGHDLRGHYYCAIIDGNIVGCVGVRKASWFLTEIYHVYVSDEYRNQRIGNHLVQAAIDASKTPLVSATVRENNTHSMKLFSRLKFRVAQCFQNEGHYVFLLIRKKDVAGHGDQGPIEINEKTPIVS